MGEREVTDLTPYLDINGNERRLGLLLPPTGFVSAMPVFEDNHAEWSDAEIRDVITDPNRKLGRKLFGDDWVHNQGQWGSCNGWAGAGCYARARYLRGYTDEMQFSGAWLYSLINGGMDRGSALEDGLAVGLTNGFAELSLVPPNEIYPHLQRQREAARASAAAHKSFRAYAVKTQRGLRTALAAGFPCVVAVMAGRNFERLTNGVSGVDAGQGNHAVLCDDLVLIDGRELFDMCNSWGLGFGDRGRSFLTWASFAQTFGTHTFYAIASTEEGGL